MDKFSFLNQIKLLNFGAITVSDKTKFPHSYFKNVLDGIEIEMLPE